jgi:hypothetical protein
MSWLPYRSDIPEHTPTLFCNMLDRKEKQLVTLMDSLIKREERRRCSSALCVVQHAGLLARLQV